jgi:hypothetical protein
MFVRPSARGPNRTAVARFRYATQEREDINDFYDWFHVQVLTEFYDEILDMVVAQAKLEQQREDTRMDNPG